MIFQKKGGPATLQAVRHFQGRTEICNLTVKHLHTYAVGEAQLLAHNAACPEGRARNRGPSPRTNKLKPDLNATGPHSVFKRDPVTKQVTGYETYRPQTNPRNPIPWESVIRTDLQGKPHFNKALGQDVPTPHVHDAAAPGGVCPAMPNELPCGGMQ